MGPEIVLLMVTGLVTLFAVIKALLWVGRIPTRKQQAKEREQARKDRWTEYYEACDRLDKACVEFLAESNSEEN